MKKSLKFDRPNPKLKEIWQHHSGKSYQIIGFEKIGIRARITRKIGGKKVMFVFWSQEKLILVHDDKTKNADQVLLEDESGNLMFVSLPVFMGKIGIHYRFAKI